MCLQFRDKGFKVIDANQIVRQAKTTCVKITKLLRLTSCPCVSSSPSLLHDDDDSDVELCEAKVFEHSREEMIRFSIEQAFES